MHNAHAQQPDSNQAQDIIQRSICTTMCSYAYLIFYCESEDDLDEGYSV